MSGPPVQYHGDHWDLPLFIKVIGIIIGAAAALIFVASEIFPYENNLYFYAWWAVVIFAIGFLIPCIAWSVISWIARKTKSAANAAVSAVTRRAHGQENIADVQIRKPKHRNNPKKRTLY